MSSSMSEVVPHPSSTSCLSRASFLSAVFDADAFIGEKASGMGGAAALETIRDELGEYLKHLRAAMIELINADYADFVALSANLIGLDENIKRARSQADLEWIVALKEAQNALDEQHDNLNRCLEIRRKLREKKEEVDNNRKMHDALDKVEWLLYQMRDEKTSGLHLDRLASEANHLNFCRSLNESDEALIERSNEIENRLEATVRQALLTAANDHDEVGVARALRLCTAALETRGGLSLAVKMVKSGVIEPRIKLMMDQTSNDSSSLSDRLKRLTSIMDENEHSEVTTLLNCKEHQQQWRTIFMTQALLPVMISYLDASIFSPGDPDAFFANYNAIVEHLILPLEDKLGDAECIKSMRGSEAYTKLMAKWNLPVYFQIRFQEIALPVEQAMLNLFETNSEKNDLIHLKATKITIEALRQCWSDGIFMPALSHRFFRLSMQIMSRLTKAIKDAPHMAVPEASHLHPSNTMTTLKESDSKKALNPSRSSSSLTTAQSNETYGEKAQHLIPLYLDLAHLSDNVIRGLFEESVVPRIKSLELNEDDLEKLHKAWQEGQNGLSDQLPKLSSYIVQILVNKSLPVLRQVSDIPRLFRRTNRGVPTAPCAYLAAMLNPMIVFKETYHSMCSEQVLQEWLISALVKVSDEYLGLVVEVLEAVQKMEESLRRLKRVRDTRSGKAKEEESQGINNVSDDNKIRLQLFVDVKAFITRIINELGVDPKQLGKSIEELENRVNEATNELEAVKKEYQLL